MVTRKHAPSDAPAEVDEIAALEAAIVLASEQSWAWHGVSEQERVRLRPGVAAIAQAATAQLRAEHAARTRSTL